MNIFLAPLVVPIVSWGIALIFFLLCVAPVFLTKEGAGGQVKLGYLLAAIVWYINTFYTWWLTGFMAPIRVDMFIIIPVLLVVTIVGIVSGFKKQTIEDTKPGMAGMWGLLAGGLVAFLLEFLVVLHKRI